jgi:hypothetical protein
LKKLLSLVLAASLAFTSITFRQETEKGSAAAAAAGKFNYAEALQKSLFFYE